MLSAETKGVSAQAGPAMGDAVQLLHSKQTAAGGQRVAGGLAGDAGPTEEAAGGLGPAEVAGPAEAAAIKS